MATQQATFLDDFVEPAGRDEALEISEWLDGCGDVTTLVLLLRMKYERAQQIEALFGTKDFGGALRWSMEESLAAVRAEWNRILAPGSVWGRVMEFAGLHACAIRGPVSALRQLVNSRLWAEEESPVCGWLGSEPVQSPEVASDFLEAQRAAEEEVVHLVKVVLPDVVEWARQQPFDHRSQEFLEVFEMQAAVLGDQFRPWLQSIYARMIGMSNRDRARAQVTNVLNRAGGSYVDGLGIGNFEHWGDGTGAGQTVCIVDSGADESHPILRQQVKHYVRFDFAGQEKEAYACMDNACHGTKIASLVCGQRIEAGDLDLNYNSGIRIGMAPGAKAVVVSALGGGFKRENGTIAQIVAALDWASRNARSYGYEVVNVSVEPARDLSQTSTRRIDLLFKVMKEGRKLIPIVACGNRASFSAALGTAALYVGAADRRGRPLNSNGNRIDLLAPGHELLCAQPGTAFLHDCLLGCHSGSSLAAAIVSGAILALASRRACSAQRAVEALESTVDANGFINIERAEGWI